MIFGETMKKILIKISKVAGCILAGIAGFALLYFGVEFCCSRIAVPAEKTTAPQDIIVYVKTNGVHADIVVPVRNDIMDWSREIPFSNNVSQDTVYGYLGLGWGDKGFFIDMPSWSDLTFSLAFHAVFWLNTTAMHATYYKEMTEDRDCRRITISHDEYVRLVEFIGGRFKKDADGHFINIKTDAAYGVTDAFYEARGRYNLFYTCNTWTNDALAASGQRHCLWTVFDRGILLKYK